jgi:hypothetical protein
LPPGGGIHHGKRGFVEEVNGLNKVLEWGEGDRDLFFQIGSDSLGREED